MLAARIPADAVGYLEVNLDPPAGQKVAAIRFLRRFPDAKVGSEDGSLVESVIEPLIGDLADRQRFAEHVRPWLGQHVAVALDPQEGKAQVVVVAGTEDEAATRAGLDTLNAAEPDEDDRIRYAIADGVAYLARTQPAADTAARDAPPPRSAPTTRSPPTSPGSATRGS